MEPGWGVLGLFCLAGLIAWFWHDSLAARESANAAAMSACRRLELQFLDGTAAFVRLWPVRQRAGLKLRRVYVFDYTANSIQRRQGFVVLIGSQVESVGFAADDSRSASPPASLGQHRRIYGQLPAAGQAGSPTAGHEGLAAGGDHANEPAIEPPPAATDEACNILDLAQWRARQRQAGSPAALRRKDGGR